MYSTMVYRNPVDYDSSNKLHVRDAMQALDKYSHLLRWKEEERVLDVGSGTGNVTTTVLAPRLSADYKLLVGFDISEYNKKYASDNYSDPRIKFIQGDIIQPDLQMLTGYFEKEDIEPAFDKIFSLHCLHWVANSKQWTKNIYSLLRPGGQTFLMFFTHTSILEMWIEVALSEKWAPYTKTIGPYRNEFYYSTDIDNDLTKVMTNAGFVIECCEHYECYFNPEWPVNEVHRLFSSSDPYVHTVPENLHSDYFEDLLKGITKFRKKYNKTGMPYTVSIIIASKPEMQPDMPPTIVYRKPAMYDASNLPLLRDAKQALSKYSHLLRWKEGERAVDVGCGTGNVTTQILVPYLPADYKLLVGFDLSEHNVKYAAENYSSHHVTYLQGDIIEPDYQKLKGYFEKENISTGFDKVFSLHCLHWVKNSEQWSRNIYSLLKPGGQTFLLFFTNCSFIELWIEAAFSERWIPYTKTVGPIRSEFHYSTDIIGDLTKVMTNAGFTVESCEHYVSYFDKQWTDDTQLSLLQSADPYVHTIPEELHSDYFEDLLSVYKKYKNKYIETGMPYTNVVIVASKPEN